MTRRVLFVSGEYPPMRGGIGDYTACLRVSLAELGWESWVLTSAEARAEDRQVLPWVERWDWSLAGQLREVATEIGAELIHLQYQAGAFAMHPALNLVPLALARRGGPPLLTGRWRPRSTSYSGQ